VVDVLWMSKSPCSRTKRYSNLCTFSGGSKYGSALIRVLLAASATGSTTCSLSFRAIMPHTCSIEASILLSKIVIENPHMGPTGMQTDWGMNLNRSAWRYRETMLEGGLDLIMQCEHKPNDKVKRSDESKLDLLAGSVTAEKKLHLVLVD
jgi:hypothetical protein